MASGSFDTTKDFEFFSWSGDRLDKPKKIKLDSLDGLNPEAVVLFPGNSDEFLAVSDDGGEAFPGEVSKNKNLPHDETRIPAACGSKFEVIALLAVR